VSKLTRHTDFSDHDENLHDKLENVIGVDLGATKVYAGRIVGDAVTKSSTLLVSASGTEQQVIDEVIASVRDVWSPNSLAIGIGVPSVVDSERGIVYDVQNIPSWKEVPLKDILQEEFEKPVFINNDANCFALGEKYFGEGQGFRSLVGLITGTGMAAGIVIDGSLYNGLNCGAGEFGMIPYLEHNYEYYCSGQFFENVHHTRGLELFEKAVQGHAGALEVYGEYGFHLANALIAILYALDPDVIILGGSVSKGFAFYKSAMYKQLNTFAYRSVLDTLDIRVSSNPDVAVMGAAALCYEDLSVKSKLMDYPTTMPR